MSQSLPATKHISNAPREAAGREKLSAKIAESVKEMPELTRRVFVLSHYRGYSLSKISETIDISERDAASQLVAASRLLFDTLRSMRRRGVY